MKKTVLTYGLISGAIVLTLMLAAMPFNEKLGSETGAYVVGYTIIVLSALLVFFGVRSYRENVGGGRLSFGRGFGVGILITLISSACYVGGWEVVYFNFMPDFADKYAARMIEREKAKGASQQKIEETQKKAQDFKRMYDNLAINMAFTFMEVFPVGLVMTLISAAILRKREAAAPQRA